jgi:hypothetical protein
LIGSPTVIGGVPLPSDTPLFLTFVALHVAAGLTCVLAGVVAMLSRKQLGRRPLAGSVHYWALACAFVTMTLLSISRWAEDYQLFARRAVIRRRDDRANGEEKALALLGARPPDWDGRVLHSPDDGLLC